MVVSARARLDGRVAIVTGGGRGLGRAEMPALAEAGASVVVTISAAGAAKTRLRAVPVAGMPRTSCEYRRVERQNLPYLRMSRDLFG